MSRYLTLSGGIRQWQNAIATSVGSADAAKLICTNAAGAIDESLLPGLPIGSPGGLTLSRNSTNPTTRLDIEPGRAIVPVGSDRFVAISAAIFTKRLDAVWAQGSGNGGRFSGTVAANQTWHVFLMRNATTGAIDFGFDTSPTAANAPAGWDERMIGSIMTDSNSQIRNFLQVGDRFIWATAVLDLSTTAAPTATTNLQTLTVPRGIRTIAIGGIDINHPSAGFYDALIGSPEIATADWQGLASPANTWHRMRFETPTNTSAQVRLYAGQAGGNLNLRTMGFIHPRGAW